MSHNEAEAFSLQAIHKTILENVDSLRGQRACLVTDITKMSDEVLDLSQRLEEIRKKHEQELQQMLSDKSTSHQQVLTLKQEVMRLKNATDSMEPIKRHLELSIADKQGQLNRIENKLEESRSVVVEYTEQIEQARHLWNDVISRATTETKNLEQVKYLANQLEPNRRESQDLQIQIQKLKAEESTVSESLIKLQASESELRAKISSLTLAFEQQRQQELSALRKQHEAEIAIAKIKMENDNLSSKNSELRADNQTINNAMKIQLEKKAELDDNLAQIQGKLRTNQANLAPLQELLTAKQEEIEKVNHEIDLSRITLKDLCQQLAEKENKNDQLDAKFKELSVENKKMTVVNDTLKTQETEWRYKIALAQQELQNVENDLANTKKETESITAEVKKMRELNERCFSENQEMLSELSTKQHSLAKVQAAKTEEQQKCDGITSQIEDISRIKSNLEQERASLGNALAELQNNYGTLLNQQNIVEVKLAELEEKTIITNSDIENKQTQVISLEAQIEAGKNDLVELNTKISKGIEDAEQYKIIEAEYAAAQIRLRDLAQKEIKSKKDLEQSRKNESMARERAEALEQKENEILNRLETARNELALSDGTAKGLFTKISDAEAKLEKINRTSAEAAQKRETMLESLKLDTEAIREAREHLRKLEDLQKSKLKEIESLQLQASEASQLIKTSEENSRSSFVNSTQIRAEAEKTLDTLRKHLNSVVPNKENSSSKS